jgi:hypothetical protein
MFNPWLIAGAATVLFNLASCAGQQQQVARERQDHDAECRKFGAAIDTPTYVDCRVALRAIQHLQQAASSPLKSPIWREAGGSVFGRESREEKQRDAHSEERSKERSCARIKAGQLIVFECGLGIPLRDLLAGLEP